MQNLITLKDVASLLKIKPYRIAYVLTMDLVPEPALRVGNKRAFSQEDIARLAKHFGVTLEEAAAS